MIETEIDPDVVKDARALLFDGLADKPTLKEVLKVGDRQIERYIADGMPFVKFGRGRLFDLAVVRQWIITRHSRSREPRKPGRPRRFSRRGAAE